MVTMRGNGEFYAGAILKAAGRAEKRVLMRFGSFVMTTARQSIKPRKGISDPGDPPTKHSRVLTSNILFAHDPARRSVVIGPRLLPGKIGAAPSALEYGGPSEALAWRRGKRRRRKTRVAERPFMRPAMLKELPNLPRILADSIK